MKNYYKRRDMTPGKLVQELKGEGAVRQIKNINTFVQLEKGPMASFI